ncbi:putative SNARE protein (Ufe1), partial [Aspergillus thermomutatus]
NAEKSLLEISSLQQTLVSHLSTQEEYIEQLVMDASTTTSNIGQGNKELKRATQQRSTAQAVFWGTVGLSWHYRTYYYDTILTIYTIGP